MYVSVEFCNDKNGFDCSCKFRCNGTVIARCDELDYHATKTELELQGYIIR